MFGNLLLSFKCDLLIFLVFSTAIHFFCKPNLCGIFCSIEFLLKKVKELLIRDWPKLANIGRPCTGPGVGIEAFASPIWDQTIDPPLTTNSGLTAKKDGFHKTKSAIVPLSIDPTYVLIP